MFASAFTPLLLLLHYTRPAAGALVSCAAAGCTAVLAQRPSQASAAPCAPAAHSSRARAPGRRTCAAAAAAAASASAAAAAAAPGLC